MVLSTNVNYIQSVLFSFVPLLTVYVIVALSGLGWIFTLVLILTGNVIGYIALSSLVYFAIYWRSALLGSIFLTGALLGFHNENYPSWTVFGTYLMCLSFFHLSEFVFTALFNHKQATTDSFMLNHSTEYSLAALVSWTEFFIEAYFFPLSKTFSYTRFIGLFLIVFGEFFRKSAMYTAGTSFNHYVQETRQQDHILITNGVYSLVRHPSYFGWFYWCIGTQVLLANPVCVILYAVAAWKFFESRISYEEFYLIKFFGKRYTDYQSQVSTGIPFVKGYVDIHESLD